MYWNNPKIELTWPSERDPVKQSLHNGHHCLFYDGAVNIDHIQPQQTLEQLCAMANQRLQLVDKSLFTSDTTCHDWLANMVKINSMVQSIQQVGIVKPMLLIYSRELPFVPATGDSRLKALACLPHICTVPAIISTHKNNYKRFQHLRSLESFDDFANVCNATPGTNFVFRLTDFQADHGLDWYEYSHSTVSVPSIDWCLHVLKNYLDHQPSSFRFSKAWFSRATMWQ